MSSARPHPVLVTGATGIATATAFAARRDRRRRRSDEAAAHQGMLNADDVADAIAWALCHPQTTDQVIAADGDWTVSEGQWGA